MFTKRGEPQKVDEAFISRVNEFGISPLTSERRLNLRTMSARAKDRLEKKVDEQHGWSSEEVASPIAHSLSINNRGGDCWGWPSW